MDLEKMKSSWKKISTPTGTKIIDQEIIHEMIENTGKGSVNRLRLIEIIGIGMLILCILFGAFGLAPENIYRVTWFPVTFLILCAISIVWQVYKISFLRKIDMAQANLIDVARKIYTYRKYIVYENIIGFLGYCIIIPAFMIDIYLTTFGNTIILPLIIFFIIIFIVGVAAGFYLYKKLYFKNIKKIQQLLAEIKEFEQE